MPTNDSYGYLEVETESESIEDAYAAYKEAMGLIKGTVGVGLEKKDFDAWLDRYLTDHTGDADKYAQMNEAQTRTIQDIKRSMARIRYKQTNGNK